MKEAIPNTEGAVLAYVPPLGNALAGAIEGELEYIRSADSTRIRLAPLTLTEDGILVGTVEKLLVADVKALASVS